MATKNTSARAEIEAAFEAVRKQENLCSLGRVIAEHEAGDVLASKVNDTLHYSAATVSRVLKGLGLPSISPETINHHRKGICRCS